jgi:hypothetical protein
MEAVTTLAETEECGAAGVVEEREAAIQSDRLRSGLFFTSVALAEVAWFAGLIYLGAHFL